MLPPNDTGLRGSMRGSSKRDTAPKLSRCLQKDHIRPLIFLEKDILLLMFHKCYTDILCIYTNLDLRCNKTSAEIHYIYDRT